MGITKKFISRSLRLFFEILYTDLAWSYDAVAWLSSIGQWRVWQWTGLESLQPGNTLEIGFGTGHLLKELATGDIFAVGVDISGPMTRIARKRLRKANLPVLIARASSYQLPFPETFFASVLSTFPSDFIYKRETFDEIYRVLMPGGKMVIVPGVQKITGPRAGGNVFLRILDKFSAWLYARTGEETNAGTNWREKLVNQLKVIGFSTIIESVTLDRSVVIRIIAQKDYPPS
jgi:ubiquinone/menaquinone biosynthesis C-methylase UbiE